MTLLGAIRDNHIRAISTVKAVDLLRLLVVDDGSWMPSEHYVDLLWPDVEPERGRASLRTALAQLRRALGPDAVQRSGDLLHLGDVRSDVAGLRRAAAQVDRAVREGQDGEAVQLALEAEDTFGGDLVVASTSCDAVYAARDELRGTRGRMLLDAAAAAARLGWVRDGLGLAQTADATLGTEESARALMLAFAGLGEMGRAIEVFERLRARLGEEFGVEPAPVTRALYLQVLTAGDRTELGPVACHLDVAARLAEAVRALRSGPVVGGVVWVQGDPGAGRGTVIAQAGQLLDDMPAVGPGSLDVLPEVVGLDAEEAQRLREEASERQCVLVVPVRSQVARSRGGRELVVRVGRLDRGQLYDMLCQLLQERPTRRLANRVWSSSAGLAGQACRTVTRFVTDDRLYWTPGGIDLRSDERPMARVRAVAGRTHRALLAPVVVEAATWVSPAESGLGVLMLA